jgi:hypothetical protein
VHEIIYLKEHCVLATYTLNTLESNNTIISHFFRSLPFLTELRLSNIVVEAFGKEVFRFLLGGCADIEKLYLSFADTAYFFSGTFRSEV